VEWWTTKIYEKNIEEGERVYIHYGD
jgi:hypothetical protein